MNFETAIALLCETLKKSRVCATVISPIAPLSEVIDLSVRDIINGASAAHETVQGFTGILSPKTMYRYTDEFGFSYTYFTLSGAMEGRLLFVGPYLSEHISANQLLELGERLGISPRAQRYFESFYINVPVLGEGNPNLILLDTLCEQMWKTPSFPIVNVNATASAPSSTVGEATSHASFDDNMFNIKAMEARYRFENEIMQAVALGQLHKERMLTEAFSDKLFERRVADPVRNAKNYSIIMNTLLRKAAEQGGVHPVYIDRMSSDFAIRIEQIASLSQNFSLMREMFRSYCRLVRKHSIKHLSLIVQKTVLLIDSDLSRDLSLSSLAKQQNISSAYLSTIFKKEIGRTVSEYIREKRIKHAAKLLTATHLQVQTVALHCGIMDVQYFSKLFKKQMGKTPKEYRAAAYSKS